MFSNPMLSLLVVAVGLCHWTAAQLTSTGLSVSFNGVDYYISPYTAGNITVNATALSAANSMYGFYPVTVIQQDITVQDIPGVVSNFTSSDDVFQEGFLQAVLFPGATTGQSTSPEGTSYTTLELDSSSVPSGPYFLEAATGSLYMTYRLYSDYSGSFIEPLLQTPTGTFQYASAQIAGSDSLTIAVPSRLYYTPTADKPLAGVRLAIKDIYDLNGVKTSNGNRAWYNLYPPANATGPAMQSLIDAGAIVVGKQKPSQFANGEEATADWVDYHSPFNPRGDGYQDPSSSSSGAGASIGSYEWLDIAVGSDTGGSIRGPSEVQGLFGNRPSHGLVSLDDVMPLSPVLDTAGFLTRDPYLWGRAQAVLYGANYTSPIPTTLPSTIYVYDYPTNSSESEASSVLVSFMDSLANLTGAAVKPINLTTLWASTANSTTSLDELMNITYPILISKQQIELVRKPFYADYGAVHDGRVPFVDPAPLARWAFGDSYPASALTDAINNKTLFMNWFNSEVLPRSDNPDICSDSLLIYVGSTGGSDDGANERNQYFDPPTPPYGFSSGRFSVMSECPDSVIPIGQASYFANTTMHEEYLPVTVDVLAAKGCDGLIVNLAQMLVESGIIQVPKVGQTIYGGDVLMKKRAEGEGLGMRYVG